MTRKLKTLLLAPFAVLAVVVVGVSAAWAAAPEFHVEQVNAIITGVGPQPGHEGYFKFTNEKNKATMLKCTQNQFGGISFAKTFSSVTLKPTYAKCTLDGAAATVKMNECDIVLSLVAASNPPTATTDIVCGGTNEITIESGACTIHVEPQMTLKHVLLGTNTGAGATEDNDALFELIGMKYTITKGCADQNQNEKRTDGRYTEEVTFQAFTEMVVQQGLFVK